MADILILPPSGCGTLGNQVSLGSILKVVPTSEGRHGGQPSWAATDQHKNYRPSRAGSGDVVDDEGRGHHSWMTKSEADEPASMLFTDASLSGHIAVPEVGHLAGGTQADAAATDANAPSRAMDTYPRRRRSRPQRYTRQWLTTRTEWPDQIGGTWTYCLVTQAPVNNNMAPARGACESPRDTYSTDACATPSRKKKATLNQKVTTSTMYCPWLWPA